MQPGWCCSCCCCVVARGNRILAALRKTAHEDYVYTEVKLSRYLRREADCKKRSFHAAVSGVFGKLLKLSSNEVTLERSRTKCTSVMLHGWECFHLEIIKFGEEWWLYSSKCQILWWTSSLFSLFSLCLYLCFRCCVFVCYRFLRWIKIYI